MNVKKHRCLVWVVMISLLLGTWNGSVAKGEEHNPPVATGKVRQITQVKLEMNEPVVGEPLPSNVEITEVQVETSSVDSAGIERPVIETVSVESAMVETISWESGKTVGEFEPINDWKGHPVENNTAYKVNITLKTEKHIFKNGVKVCMGDEPLQEKQIKIVSDTKIQVSKIFEFGTLATPMVNPTSKPSATITPSATPTMESTAEPPTATPTASPTDSPTVTPAVIDTLSVEGVVPPVGDQKFPKEELRVTTKFPDAIATIEPGWHSDSEPTEGIGEIAEFNKTYVLWIQLTAEVGYEFGEMLDPGVVKDINGIPIDKVEVEHDKENKGKVIIKCTFPTGPKPIQTPKVINKLYVDGVEAPSPATAFPEENLKIRTNFSSGNDDEGVVEESNIVWKNEEGKDIQEGETVDFGKIYRLCITLTVKDDKYKFAEQGLSVEGNGIPVNTTHEVQNGKKVIITCEFPTEKKPATPHPLEVTKIDSIFVKDVDAPVAGKGLPEGELKVSTNLKEDHSGAIATIESDWYSETGEKIGKEETAILGNKYVLWIKLTAGDGYVFNEKLNPVEVKDKNGENFMAVYDEENEGKVVIIKCTFEAKENPDKPASAPPTAEPPTATPLETPATTPPSALIPLVTPSTTYTVTLDANGGKFKNSKQKKKEITFTTEDLNRGGVNLPKKGEITKKGCIFIGWYKGKTRVKEITEPGNVTLKAQWVANTVTMGYPGGTFKWVNFKLDSNVKLTDVSIKEKKYRSFVKIDKKKKTIKGKKYFKKANLILTIDGEDVKGVTLEMKLPEPRIHGKPTIKRKRYATGVYTTYKITYKYKKYKGARVEAIYSYKKNGGYKKCVSALNQPKGGLVSVKQGTIVYMKVKVYYGNACSVSKRISLKG